MPLNELGDLPLDVKDVLLDNELRSLAPRAFRGLFYLIFEQWQNGPLPHNLGELASLARCTPTVFKRHVWPEIHRYFEKTTVKDEVKLIEPLSYTKRIEAVKKMVKRQELAAKQRVLWAKKNSPTP